MANKSVDKKKGRYNFLIDSSVYSEFSRLCSELGLIRSKAVENHMRDFVKRQTVSISHKHVSERKGRYNFMIDSGIYDEFSSVCDGFGLVRSKNIEGFMREFVEKNRR